MNKFYMAVMAFGLGAEASMVLTVPGRKSGKPRSTPITVFSVEGKRYVLGGFPDRRTVAPIHQFVTVTY